MSLFHRFNHCYGLTLWPRGKTHVELWVCFAGVRRHRHPGQHVEVLPIFGWADFIRIRPCKHSGVRETVRVSPLTWFHWFSIHEGWPHWFTLSCPPLIFINRTFNGKSAADNFVA